MNRSGLAGRRFACVLTASALLAGMTSCNSDDPTPPVSDPECVVPTVTNFVDSAQARVIIRNFAFQPASITVKAGQTVIWKHCGPERDPHTVTSDEGTSGPLNSPFFGVNQTYTMSFAASGSNPYHCAPHPDMLGTITVVP